MLALGADPTADPRTAFAWNTNITSYVRYSDRIRIARGRSDEQSQTPPSRCAFTLTNNDARFTVHNPSGPYYGQFGLNTPVRVEVNPGTGWVTRFVGFVSELAAGRDTSGNDRTVQVTASGVLRRLGQGNTPAKSLTMSIAQYQAEAFAATHLITTYWPLEDAAGTTAAATGLPAGTPMAVAGTVTFAAVTPPAGSAANPNVSAGSLVGVCNETPNTGAWSTNFYFNCTGDCRVVSWTTTGTLSWFVDVTSTTVTIGNDGGGSAALSADYTDGEWHVITVFGFDDGGAVTFSIFGDSDSASSFTAGTAGRVSVVTVNPSTDADLVSVGHIIVGGTSTSSFTTSSMNGDPGASAMANFAGVAGFNDVAVDYTASIIFDTELMGPQSVGPLLSTLQECADADEGLMLDRITGELGFESHFDRENLSVALALDWAEHELQPNVKPVDDDQRIRNDWTITSPVTAGQVVDEDGPLGVTAVGRYDDTATLNLYTNDQPRQHAGWKVNLGTIHETRFPGVVINLAHDPGLIAAWLAADVGSRLTIANPPADVAPEQIDQIIEGYSEQIDQFMWVAALNCAPYEPYKIFELTGDQTGTSEFVGRLAGDANAAIRGALTNSATSIPFDPNRYRWTTTHAGLVLPGTSGNYVSTPDAAALDVVGDIDIRADVTLADWTPSGTSVFVAKWGAAGNRSYLFQLTTGGLLELAWSANGTATIVKDSTTAVSITEGRLAVRATLDVDNGAAGNDVTFYTAPTIDGPWTQLGATVTTATATSIFSGNLAVEVGAQSIGTVSLLTGTVHAAKILDGIGGTEVANPDFTIQVPGSTSFTDTAGRTWTVNGTIPVIIESDFPFDLRLLASKTVPGTGGEVVTVSSIATTPVTYVAATAHVHADNASVTPTISASAAADDLLLILAAIRSSGTGTMSTPAGYTRLPVFAVTDNVQLFAKVHSGSEVNPAIVPSGGSTGDTVSAQMAVIRGTPTSLTDLADIVVDSSILLNASAQNVAYPGLYPQQEGCFVLAVMWKQDDHAGVATLSGFTEIDDPTTTTGNDQSLAWDYQIQTRPAVVNEGSFVVTGGASAISRAAVVAFAAGYQTATVTRSTNGVMKAHTAATKIEVEDAFVLGL